MGKETKGTNIDAQIVNIVQNHSLREQSEIQQRLKERGYEIPQATLSRRLKKLKIAKVSGVYQIIEFHLPSLPPLLGVKVSDTGLMVLHTYPGHGNSLAYLIDQKYVSVSGGAEEDTGIIGTIAGDDTVLIILQNKSYVSSVMDLLQNEFPQVSF